jgi:hypothetical protein
MSLFPALSVFSYPLFNSYPERDMPIRYEHVETVATSPERAFAVIDDLPLTAKWLPPCVSLAKVGAGPNASGDKLRYVFKQGGRHSEMGGRDSRPGPRGAAALQVQR